jgi:hypothetical protein
MPNHIPLGHRFAVDFPWVEVAAEDAQHVAQEIDQHQRHPQGRELYLHVVHDLNTYLAVVRHGDDDFAAGVTFSHVA